MVENNIRSVLDNKLCSLHMDLNMTTAVDFHCKHSSRATLSSPTEPVTNYDRYNIYDVMSLDGRDNEHTC